MVDGVEDEELGSNSLRTTGGHLRRWTTTDSGKDVWLPELSILKRGISSILNPLKVCSSNVVNQFARIAHSTNFIYCYTILDVNRRSEHADSSPIRYGGERNATVLLHPKNIAELNTFFPFDPCRLPKSNGFIQGVYREWESVRIQGDDDDDDEEEEEEDTQGPDGEGVGGGTGARLAIPNKTSDIHLDEEGLALPWPEYLTAMINV
jgi:RNA polymerase I-specific transcription initiation factor RRN3